MSLVTTYLNTAKAQWPTLAVSSVLFGGGLGVLPFLQAPSYQAETVLSVSFVKPTPGDDHHPTPTTAPPSRSGPTDGPTLPPEPPSRALARNVTTFTQLANSKQVIRAAVSSLGLTYSDDELADHVSASTPFNSKTINISVTDTEPKRAAALANGLADELADVADHTAVPAGEDEPVLTVDRKASAPAEPLPVAWPVPVFGGLLAGLAVGLAIAVYRRPPASVSGAPVDSAQSWRRRGRHQR